VFDYVRRAMPYTLPQSLIDAEVYAVTAYLLNLNGIIGERQEMNAQTLPKVTMPNRLNFMIVYPSCFRDTIAPR
jgi:S-disulfanyl-L-cysteine oxidoreductase SoxD